MEQITATAWQTLTGLLTPPLIGAVAVTLAGTHTAKIMAEQWYPRVTESARRWRAFCAAVSLSLGALAGIGAWIGADAPWYIIPAVAFGSGPAWSIARRAVPAKYRKVLLTSTDCKYRRNVDAG